MHGGVIMVSHMESICASVMFVKSGRAYIVVILAKSSFHFQNWVLYYAHNRTIEFPTLDPKATLLILALSSRHFTSSHEPQTWSNIIDMLLYMRRDVIFRASWADHTRHFMLPRVLLSLQKVFSFVYLGIELDPLLVDRLGDAISINTAGFKPCANTLDGCVGGGEQFNYLVGGVVLTVFWRIVS
jgi:hypothetical protein